MWWWWTTVLLEKSSIQCAYAFRFTLNHPTGTKLSWLKPSGNHIRNSNQKSNIFLCSFTAAGSTQPISSRTVQMITTGNRTDSMLQSPWKSVYLHENIWNSTKHCTWVEEIIQMNMGSFLSGVGTEFVDANWPNNWIKTCSNNTNSDVTHIIPVRRLIIVTVRVPRVETWSGNLYISVDCCTCRFPNEMIIFIWLLQVDVHHGWFLVSVELTSHLIFKWYPRFWWRPPNIW